MGTKVHHMMSFESKVPNCIFQTKLSFLFNQFLLTSIENRTETEKCPKHLWQVYTEGKLKLRKGHETKTHFWGIIMWCTWWKIFLLILTVHHNWFILGFIFLVCHNYSRDCVALYEKVMLSWHYLTFSTDKCLTCISFAWGSVHLLQTSTVIIYDFNTDSYITQMCGEKLLASWHDILLFI